MKYVFCALNGVMFSWSDGRWGYFHVPWNTKKSNIGVWRGEGWKTGEKWGIMRLGMRHVLGTVCCFWDIVWWV